MNLIKLALVSAALSFSLAANAIVVDFEDLSPRTRLVDTEYAGLTWEAGQVGGGYSGNTGSWLTTSTSSNNYPIENQNIINGWGALLLGISFNAIVDVDGAFFAAQGSPSSHTSGVRVHGFLNGIETSVTDWFTDIDMTNSWFAMNLLNVDRIVIESQAVTSGGGWYGMDNLTYNSDVSPVPVPASLWLFGSALIGFGSIARRRKNKA